MFGVYSGADDDENDDQTIPTIHQHFNPAVRPKSKLGRRRLMQPKEKNAIEATKQDTQPLPKPSQWSKDDSGVFPSDSTPSLTHPVSRTGNANFNAKLGAGSFTSTFTPSYKSNQENKLNKVALPSTPRFRSEPLKEINCVDSVNQVVNQITSNPFPALHPDKDVQEATIQKQLNSSFIDDSLPLSVGATSKIANETPDFSNDSSFMTCHDIHDPQPNKTVYDPAFLKTPGRNLAEIRIDESPFNPLENFLEESDDFPSRKTQPKTTEVRNDKSRLSDPLAFPLDCPNANQVESPSKLALNTIQNNQVSHQVDTGCRERAYSDSRPRTAEFKHPSLPSLKTPRRADLDQNPREHTTPSSGYISEKSFHTEETTHVTYPQPSKPSLGQKNTFTSQFSLNSYKSEIPNTVKVLSLHNQGYEPLSAASFPKSHGLLSHFNQGSHSGRTVHRLGNVRDSRAEVDRPVAPSSGLSEISQDETDTSFNSAEKTVVSRNAREPGPGGGKLDSRRDEGTGFGSEVTLVPKGRVVHSQQQQKVPDRSTQTNQFNLQPGHHQSRVVAEHPAKQQFRNQQSRPQFGGQPSDVKELPTPQYSHQTRPQSACQQPNRPVNDPPGTNPVLSALIKPQPQNVITIKGTPYTVLSLLGKGGSSQVYQALGPQSSKLMAIKCVNLASVEEAMATDYLNEIALLSKLQGCPSVIKMFDHEYVEQSQMLYVVLEKGDIDFSKLVKNISETNQISMPMILYYWSEMLNAVHEIHKRGIIHSDLKPANFLLVEGRLKLIDFGIASSIQGDTTSVMKDVPAGTYNYMSPESITGPKITRKSDVWSMGCILFNLLYGRTPFSHLNNRWQKLHAIADANHPVTFPPLKHHAPPSLRLTLRWCLNKDPALRPTVEELVTLSELSPPADSGLGKEIDGMMCQYFRKVLPNLRNLIEDSWEHPSK